MREVVDHGAQADAEVEGGGDQQGEERFDRVHAAVGLRVLVDLVEEGGGREPLEESRWKRASGWFCCSGRPGAGTDLVQELGNGMALF